MAEETPGRRGAPARPPARAAAEHAPWKPIILTEQQIYAIKALERGEAGPEEQKRALRAIVYDICRTYDDAYRPGPDGDRETNYALGMQKAGREIVKCLNVDFAELKRRREKL